MKTIDNYLSTESALKQMLGEAYAERVGLTRMKAPDASLLAIQYYEDAIQQYEARLALLP